jgi:integrase
MKLAAYLSRSRHGVFYFRWPIPNAPESRQTVRISLQTRCPKRASLLARYLASCGESLRMQLVDTTMRYDEIRNYVQGMLQDWLKRTIERLDRDGPQNKYDHAAEANIVSLLRSGPDDYWEFCGPKEADRVLEGLATFSGQPRTEFDANKADSLELFRKGYIAYWEAVAEHRKNLQSIDLGLAPDKNRNQSVGPTVVGEAEAHSRATLSEVVNLFIEEQLRAKAWIPKTEHKRRRSLAILVELIGGNTPMIAVTKAHAQDVKSVLLKLPSNRSKKSATRDLNLREAARVAGVASMSTQTLNDHLGTFLAFTEWAARNGYGRENLFSGMNVGKKASDTTDAGRLAFSPEDLSLMVYELTRPDSLIVKKASNRWAGLISIFTGARLNEVCGLRVSDVKEQDGVLCININDDDPDGKKHLKTKASRRTVPVHSKLVELGFTGFLEDARLRGIDARLFPDFPYSVQNGYGRNQGRWFNENLLPALGLKTKTKVLHGLRHAMITQLTQAGVPEPIVQTIVGHERIGVTLTTYLQAGFKVSQLKEAIEKFVVQPWKGS